MRPGDAYVCNDAYLAGGTHLPDISVITPVFIDGAVSYFTANCGHHPDVGGPTPGSISHSAQNIFHEGLRIPPTLLVREGVIDEGLVRLIAHNTRDPEERSLDLRVQVATNEVGVSKLRDLVRREGVDATAIAVDDLITYTRQRLLRRVEALRDGRSRFTTWMDNDGLGGEPVPICATVDINGENLSLSFAGTGPQSRGGYNVMPSGVLATVAYALKALLDPELPPNSGLFDVVKLEVPLGTILNPQFPGAVGARTTTCQKLAGAIFGALQPHLPESQRMAPSHDVLAAMVLSGERPKVSGTYVYLETIGGGNGGLSDADGMDGAHVHVTNSLNMPIEAVELEYPLRVEEYALIADSGGAGKYRGGMGIAREVRILEADTSFSVRADSFVTQAEGMEGGRRGSNARVILRRGNAPAQVLEPKLSDMKLHLGDRVRMETPGGGGFGCPSERDVRSIRADICDNKISIESARADYAQGSVEAAFELSTSTAPDAKVSP